MLPCRLSSNLAHARWTFGGRELPAEQPGSFLYDARLQALVVMAAQPRHAGAYHCFSEEQGARLAAEGYLVAVVAGPSVTLEARAPLESLGLVWLAVVALGAVCLVLLLLVLSLRRRLREELEKGAKAAERTLVYTLWSCPRSPPVPPSGPAPRRTRNSGTPWATTTRTAPSRSFLDTPGASPAAGPPRRLLASPASPCLLQLGSTWGAGGTPMPTDTCAYSWEGRTGAASGTRCPSSPTS